MKCSGKDKRRSGMDCGQDMHIVHGELETTLDSLDIFTVQKHGCANPNCTNYMGKNKENTQFIKETRTKVK